MTPTPEQEAAVNRALDVLASAAGLSMAYPATSGALAGLCYTLREAQRIGAAVEFICRTVNGKVTSWEYRNPVNGGLVAWINYRPDGSAIIEREL